MKTNRLVTSVAAAITCAVFVAFTSGEEPPAVLQASAVPPAANARLVRQFNAREFGAVGDGKSNDTGPIQQAIDACAQQGGGIVVLDQGTFLSGTLLLRSHVELHLTSTAVLLGAADLAQYRVDPKVVYKLLNQSLVFAEGCEHVAITGQGTIDGQGKAFRNGEKTRVPC